MAVLEVRLLADGAILSLEGELDMASAEVLLRATQGAPEDADLVLDVAKLTFMDSSGLRAILQIVSRRNGSSSVVLLHPTEAVKRVLDIALPGETPGLRIQLDGWQPSA